MYFRCNQIIESLENDCALCKLVLDCVSANRIKDLVCYASMSTKKCSDLSLIQCNAECNKFIWF